MFLKCACSILLTKLPEMLNCTGFIVCTFEVIVHFLVGNSSQFS